MAYDDVLNEIDGYINGRIKGMDTPGGKAAGEEDPKQGFLSSLLSSLLGNNDKGVPWANQEFVKDMDGILNGLK